MPRNDFPIIRTTREVTVVTDNRQDVTFYPTPGNNIAVAFIEATGPNSQAILDKLAEIKVLSVNYVDKIWPASALPGKGSSVSVRVIVDDSVGN